MIDLNRRAVLAAGALPGVVLAGSASAQSTPSAVTPVADRFRGKVVAITGATSGIGRAAAERFAAEGARVTFNGRRAQLGAEVERGIRARGGEATYIQTDVREPDQVRRFFVRTNELYGGLDALANNAGRQSVGATDETTLDQYAEMMDTNVRGVWLGVREALPLMRARAAGRSSTPPPSTPSPRGRTCRSIRRPRARSWP